MLLLPLGRAERPVISPPSNPADPFQQTVPQLAALHGWGVAEGHVYSREADTSCRHCGTNPPSSLAVLGASCSMLVHDSLLQVLGLGSLLACMGCCSEVVQQLQPQGTGAAGQWEQPPCQPCFVWESSLRLPAVQPSLQTQQRRRPVLSQPQHDQQQQPQLLAGWELVQLLLDSAALGSAAQLCGTACLWAAYLRCAASLQSWCHGEGHTGADGRPCCMGSFTWLICGMNGVDCVVLHHPHRLQQCSNNHGCPAANAGPSQLGLSSVQPLEQAQGQQAWQPGHEVAYVPEGLPGLLDWLQWQLRLAPGGDERASGCQLLCQQLLATPLGEQLLAEAAQGGRWLGSCELAGRKRWLAAALRQGLPVPAAMASEAAALLVRLGGG